MSGKEKIEFMLSQNAIPSNYHFGASLKDLGKNLSACIAQAEWFVFSKMDIGAFEMLTRLEEMSG